MQIEVLYGGDSPERAVSLCSGARVCEALRRAGAAVSLTDWRGGAVSPALLCRLRAADAVFLALHGGDGENGRLQELLEANGIAHYTGSDSDAAALAMHKPRAKAAVAAFGVPTAKSAVCRAESAEPPLAFPFIIKPIDGGSSLGFLRIDDIAAWQKRAVCDEMLCESYLPGREFTVGVLQDRCLPAVEIKPRGGIYDYEHKYRQGAAEELCPAPLSPSESDRLACLASVAFQALGLRDYARIDFKQDASGRFCFLEANTLPGMTETSLLPLAASAAGIDFETLCIKMARLAAERKRNE